jgi:hypothetical protein
MITVSLIVFLMILSVLAEAVSILLGIPEITQLTRIMNGMSLLIIAIKYVGIGISFLYQQYERSRNVYSE